uniref:Potassium channel domain-containing protein n=1 Tax=Plectus sambesii TaxID=2011161 RepID=A0A914XHN6_9BILA
MPILSERSVLQVVKLSLLHGTLYICVILYLLLGAHVFLRLEGTADEKPQLQKRIHSRHRLQEDMHKVIRDIALYSRSQSFMAEARLTGFIRRMQQAGISVEELENPDMESDQSGSELQWADCVLFTFTIVSTIGYGKIAPSTAKGKIFVMVYGIIGIPLFLVALADMSQFISSGISMFISWICARKNKKTTSRREQTPGLCRLLFRALAVISVFSLYVAAGALVLPVLEELGPLDSIYFAFVSLTTIGFGDIVPKRMTYLAPTLAYITIGLWLTTEMVHKVAELFRMVHFVGRRATDIKDISVWLGGCRVTVLELIRTVARATGVPLKDVEDINWDQKINEMIDEKETILNKKSKQPSAQSVHPEKLCTIARMKSVTSRDFFGVSPLPLIDYENN